MLDQSFLERRCEPMPDEVLCGGLSELITQQEPLTDAELYAIMAGVVEFVRRNVEKE